MDVKQVAGVPTHVYSLSNSEGSSDAGPDCQPPLAVIIPGSPGMGHFYVPFASRLFQLGQGKYDVAVVSHAGHSPGHYKNTTDYGRAQRKENIPKGVESSDTINSESECSHQDCTTDWYSLQDQIEHKLVFIEQELKTRKSLILIGHSIGCWMILKMLPRLDPAKICRVFLLFPTIEKMALTPNGQSFTSYLWTSLRIPFTGLVWMASKLIPYGLKKIVVDRHFSTTPREHLDHMTQGVINIDEKSTYNILKMAKQEMAEVVEPPFDVIDENIDKITLYYGEGDKWNVASCYEDMTARYPDKDVHICKFDHAFVECASNEVAEFVQSKIISVNS